MIRFDDVKDVVEGFLIDQKLRCHYWDNYEEDFALSAIGDYTKDDEYETTEDFVDDVAVALQELLENGDGYSEVIYYRDGLIIYDEDPLGVDEALADLGGLGHYDTILDAIMAGAGILVRDNAQRCYENYLDNLDELTEELEA